MRTAYIPVRPHRRRAHTKGVDQRTPRKRVVLYERRAAQRSSRPHFFAIREYVPRGINSPRGHALARTAPYVTVCPDLRPFVTGAFEAPSAITVV